MASTQPHGAHYDEFASQAHDPHGPHQDENYGASATAQPAKDTYGDGRQPVAGDGKHGAHFDDFGWTVVPALHGQNYDTDFAQPAMLDGVEHGTWYDIFRGGNTEIKYIYDGRDYEGTVLHCGEGEVTVQAYGHNQGGGRHTIGLGQMKEMRRMTRLGGPGEDRHPTATPGYTSAPRRASTAEAPSAHSATAHGGGRESASTDVGGKFANKTDSEVIADLRKNLDGPVTIMHGTPEAGHKFGFEQHSTGRCTSCGTAGPRVHTGAKKLCSRCWHKTPATSFVGDARKTTDSDLLAEIRKRAEAE